MTLQPKRAMIVIADDDDDDRALTLEALQACHLDGDIHFVRDGRELLEFLRSEGEYATATARPRPALILLDLNMPRVDGREALAEIKADPRLRQIPVVVLSTSSLDTDVTQAYDLGGNTYITKPLTFDGLAGAMAALKHYWFDVGLLPPTGVS